MIRKSALSQRSTETGPAKRSDRSAKHNKSLKGCYKCFNSHSSVGDQSPGTYFRPNTKLTQDIAQPKSPVTPLYKEKYEN